MKTEIRFIKITFITLSLILFWCKDILEKQNDIPEIVRVEYPESYELANIILSLTDYGKEDKFEVRKDFEYYNKIQEYFKRVNDHALLDTVNYSRERWEEFLSFRTDSHAFEFNSKLKVVPFQMTSHLQLVQARIGNNDYTFALETGAEANLIDVKFFQRVSGELKKIKKNTLSGLDQNSKEVNAGKLKKLFIWWKTLKNTETIFGDISHLNTDDDHKIDGIIGYEILSKQKALISFARKEIVFIE